jgi:hypothetical protein
MPMKVITENRMKTPDRTGMDPSTAFWIAAVHV